MIEIEATSPTIGVLVVNLGTPDAPTKEAVKTYLAEFLADPYVVQIPKAIWQPILKGIVLKIRPKKSAALYQRIWTKEGSPLLVYSLKLVRQLQLALLDQRCQFALALGMRYGKPSIRQGLQELRQQGINTLVILPLYPQFSNSTTGSTINEVKKQLIQLAWNPKLTVIEHYALEASYINAIATTIQAAWQQRTPGNKLIFSFHGLPQKSVQRGDPYFEQCHQTANRVADCLQLAKDKWTVVFQSRFGREKWLQPYCNQVLEKLPEQGYKHIDIVCPGFAVDCLETLEEVAITNKQLFHQAGGQQYHYIPALNDSKRHVHSLTNILLTHTRHIRKE